MGKGLPSVLAFALAAAFFSAASAGAVSTAMFTRICSDTDTGIDYIHWGVTKDMTGTYNDTCVNGTLREWYCDNGIARSVLHACDYGCDWGACVPDNPNLITHFYRCTDTDGGIEFYRRGVVNGNKEDKCLSSTRLVEWYCKYNMATSLAYLCPDGCDNGACRNLTKPTRATTTTTAATAPTTTSTATTQTTSTSTTTIPAPPTAIPAENATEAAAETTTTTSASTTTTSSSSTSTSTTSSTSTTLPACAETDGGRDFYRSGATTDRDGTHNDRCVGTRRIQEWYCSNGEARSAYTTCEFGCENDACHRQANVPW